MGRPPATTRSASPTPLPREAAVGGLRVSPSSPRVLASIISGRSPPGPVPRLGARSYLTGTYALPAESCIRKAVGERGLTPGLVGLVDTKAEDEAASRWADCALPMGIESPDPIPPDATRELFGRVERSSRGRVDLAT